MEQHTYIDTLYLICFNVSDKIHKYFHYQDRRCRLFHFSEVNVFGLHVFLKVQYLFSGNCLEALINSIQSCLLGHLKNTKGHMGSFSTNIKWMNLNYLKYVDGKSKLFDPYLS